MDFNEYQKKAETTVKPSVKGMTEYYFLGLASEVGEVCDKRKKYLRDDNGKTAYFDYVRSLEKELGDVLWYVAMIANSYNLSLQEIAEGNIAKLADRKERGKIGGSGDER